MTFKDFIYKCENYEYSNEYYGRWTEMEMKIIQCSHYYG